MGNTRNVREIVELSKIVDEAGYEKLMLEHGADPRSGVVRALAAARKRLDAEAAERERVSALYELMREAGEDAVVVGVDEVGRGSLAGPLTVAAVVLPLEPLILGLDDSKKLTPQKREEVALEIRRHARGIGIAHSTPASIDADGITTCLRRCMAQAIELTGIEPDLVLIDGNPIHAHPKERCSVKGDGRVACIAAASIVAKVTRDRIMVEADADYPGYHFAQSKGYGSPQHCEAIRQKGLTDFHRKSFCGGFLQETLF